MKENGKNSTCTVQLMRPGIGRNVSCTFGDCLTSRPEGCSQPWELWFLICMHMTCLCVRVSPAAEVRSDWQSLVAPPTTHSMRQKGDSSFGHTDS